ncbi:LysE/ArgO family amino acid transporter [Algicella marina]|uniref:Amino acid transporter n=1 Tax=Algicella marina TaxID=2683284 RepID=A0A6P1SZ00_9RHOB|nr:LysE/ArgO family amino acid transporter [Algicella marina]QHQ34701.1 amino acid transporter [Algicella marina]
MLNAASTGFATGFVLILAIGAQNAFVLRQGLRRAHVFWVCLTCATSDAILIAAGVSGFGAIADSTPWLPDLMRWLGVAFLTGYGVSRLNAARAPQAALALSGEAEPLRKALLTCLAFTWLNPHVYLDTLALIGAVSVPFEGSAKLAFGGGAISASFVFFFGLGYGARLLAPLLQSPRAWQILDAGIGLLMLVLALSLALH